MSKKVFASGPEKAAYYRDIKRQKENERQLKKYDKNKVLYNEKKQLKRRERRTEEPSRAALRKQIYRRQKKDEFIKEKEKRVEMSRKKKDYRNNMKLKQNEIEGVDFENNLTAFQSRTQKHRALQKLKNSLPKTPEKRVTLISSYLSDTKSPTVALIHKFKKIPTPEDLKSIKMAEAVLSDMKDIVNDTKHKRTNDARATVNIMSAAVNGENVQKSRCRIQLSKKLGFNVRRMSQGKRIRTKVLTTEVSAWTFTSRKTRSDALSEDIKRKIYEYWISPDNSRPTANKNDIKRERLGPKVYTSHMKHVLEKTQTEVYISFKEKYPDLKISQRLFERLKPYFVVPVRPCDRETCCCRYHVEARYLFKSCMDFRKKITPLSEHFPIFTHLTDLTNHTLCPKTDGQEYHQLKCVERSCDDCGVNKLHLLEDELSLTTESPNVEWMRYEYVFVPTKSGEKKKLCLVKVNTKPGEMFKYFLELISKFSAHVFRAKWQTEQLKSIKSNLKKNEAICIHDFSENYSCKDKIEIQSCYFQKTEVSIHVSVIYRHPIENLDGPSDPEVNGGLVEEQFFVISPDQVHDHNFSHEAQRQIADYLKSINYDLKTMHEFTDGCATQYKSRHCFGDLSYAKQDFGFNIVRNYFETSHAKGVQDAAGGLIKNQADFAVARGKMFIQNANDFYNFCKDNLETPRQSAICKRRIFRYVEEVPRNRTRSFKVVPSVRCIHQIRSTSPRTVLVRDLSCYDCSNCPDEYNACTSEAGIFRKYKLCHETELTERLIANSDENTFIELIQPGIILAVFTDDPGEDYYILKCLSDVKKLNQSTFDDWGNTFQAGVQLIEGLYFDKLCVNGNNIQFKLIKGKKSLIYLNSVRYICIGVESRYGKFIMTDDMHHEILAACD